MPDEKSVEAADDAQGADNVHTGEGPGDDGGRGERDQRGGARDPRVPPILAWVVRGCEANHGEDEISVELGADAPARIVPYRPDRGIEGDESLNEKQAGRDPVGGVAPGEGRLIRCERMLVDENELEDFEKHESEQHRRVQWPEAAEAPDHEIRAARRVAELCHVAVGDDEAAQHEKEIDEAIGIAHERDGVEMIVERQVMERDQESADTAPSIEDVKTVPVRLGHPAPGAVAYGPMPATPRR